MSYKIKMNKEDFYEISDKILVNNLTIDEYYVTFEIENGSYKILKNYDYDFNVIESLKGKINRLYNKYFLLCIGILITVAILFINSYRVNDICFNRDTPINNEIENTIKKSYKKILCFNFINIDFFQLSNDLSRCYFEYPSINVIKKNNNIYVNISEVIEIEDKVILNKGNLLSNKISVIDNFFIYEGKSNIYKNKVVQKGDVLIEGSNARGIVLGYTFNRIEITIPKEEKKYVQTGNKIEFNQINLFDYSYDINKKAQFDKFDKEIDEIFNLFDFFIIKKIVEFEKSAIINTYTLKEGQKLAENKIINDFNLEFELEMEKIVSITNILAIENEDSYDYIFIVKAYESLGIYEE